MSAISIANQRFTLKDGVSIAYYDSEPASGVQRPALVLLHGFCGSSAYWERIVPLLQGHIRVIAPDLRGHGLSETDDAESGAMAIYADDVAELLEQLHIKQAYVLGHSLGGYITLAFTENHADKLAGFGLVHSTSLPDSEEAKQGRDKAAQTIREEGVAAFVSALVPKLFAPDNKAAMAEELERALTIGRGTSAAGAVQAALAMKQRPDRTDVLKRSELPVLLVAGESDGVVPPEKTFLKEDPNVTLTLLANAGHMSMYEQTDKLADAVRTFTGSHKEG